MGGRTVEQWSKDSQKKKFSKDSQKKTVVSAAIWEEGRLNDGQKILDDELGFAKISSFADATGPPLDFYRRI